MMRLLHVVAITGLIGSAAYAYTVKYETLFYAEELVKLKAKLAREKDGIAVAKAEWALLTRPDRLQRMAEKHLDLQPISINQLARLSDLPSRPDRGDEIGRKLELLGLEPATTSALPRKAGDAKAADKPAASAKPAGGVTASAVAKPSAAKPPAPATSAPKAEARPDTLGDAIAKVLGLGGSTPPAPAPVASAAPSPARPKPAATKPAAATAAPAMPSSR